MSLYMRAMLAAVCLIDAAAPAATAATDAFGDPLPPGAIARLGTIRLRSAAVSLSWAPDGKTFATAGYDDGIHIWDPISGMEVCGFKAPKMGFRSVCYDPGGKRLFACAVRGKVHILDAETGGAIHGLIPPPPLGVELAAGPDKGTAVTLDHGGNLSVWDLTTSKLVRRVDGEHLTWPVGTDALSPDGRRFARWTPDGDLLTVRDSDGKEVFHTATRFKTMEGLAFSPDGKMLAAASNIAAQIVLWDAATGKELRRLDGVSIHGRALAFSAQGKLLACMGVDGAVHVWDAASGKDRRQFRLPGGVPIGASTYGGSALAFSPDGKMLAAAQGTAIHVWDVEVNKELHPFAGHTNAIADLRFSPDGGRILTCGLDGVAGRWETATGKLIAWRRRSDGGNSLAALTGPDDKTVLVNALGGVDAWDADSGRTAERPLVAGATGIVTALALSADGRTLAGLLHDYTIYVWDVKTGNERVHLRDGPSWDPPFVLSADGRLLALAGVNFPVRLWDVAADREVRSFEEKRPAPDPRGPTGAAGPARLLAFAPDGRTLAAISAGELVLWEVVTGRERMRLALPNTEIVRGAFSPHGRLLALGAANGAVLLLDATDGRELARFAGSPGGVTALAFAPDGKALASAGGDGTALIWDVKELTGRKGPLAELSPEKLPAMWTNLLDGDAKRAYQAVLALAASPKTAAPFLKERLTAGPASDAGRIARLIKELNDDEFDVREAAAKELDAMGSEALAAAHEALATDQPAESRRRLQELLERHKDAANTEEVRRERAVEALERSGAPEALEALRALGRLAPPKAAP